MRDFNETWHGTGLRQLYEDGPVFSIAGNVLGGLGTPASESLSPTISQFTRRITQLGEHCSHSLDVTLHREGHNLHSEKITIPEKCPRRARWHLTKTTQLSGRKSKSKRSIYNGCTWDFSLVSFSSSCGCGSRNQHIFSLI